MAWFKIPIKKFVIKLLNFNIENKNHSHPIGKEKVER